MRLGRTVTKGQRSSARTWPQASAAPARLFGLGFVPGNFGSLDLVETTMDWDELPTTPVLQLQG